MVEIRVKNIIVVSNVDGLKKVKSNINFVVEIRVKKAIPASEADNNNFYSLDSKYLEGC